MWRRSPHPVAKRGAGQHHLQQKPRSLHSSASALLCTPAHCFAPEHVRPLAWDLDLGCPVAPMKAGVGAAVWQRAPAPPPACLLLRPTAFVAHLVVQCVIWLTSPPRQLHALSAGAKLRIRTCLCLPGRLCLPVAQNTGGLSCLCGMRAAKNPFRMHLRWRGREESRAPRPVPKQGAALPLGSLVPPQHPHPLGIPA
jgi:hypothetical protein